jgi:hypothetical protein
MLCYFTHRVNSILILFLLCRLTRANTIFLLWVSERVCVCVYIFQAAHKNSEQFSSAFMFNAWFRASFHAFRNRRRRRRSAFWFRYMYREMKTYEWEKFSLVLCLNTFFISIGLCKHRASRDNMWMYVCVCVGAQHEMNESEEGFGMLWR